MADTFPIWQRQARPEGRLTVPQAGPGLLESFFIGGKQMMESGMEVAEAIKAKERRTQDNAIWVAARVAQAKYDLTQWHEAAKRAAAPGADDFAGAAADRFDQTVAKLAAAAPDEASGAALAERLHGFRAGLLDDALGFEARARIARRAAELETAIELAQRTVALAPAQFEALLGDVAKAVDSQPLPEKRKAAVLARARQGLAEALLQGLLERDPGAVERVVRSRALDMFLARDDKARWLRAAADRRDALRAAGPAAGAGPAGGNDQGVAG